MTKAAWKAGQSIGSWAERFAGRLASPTAVHLVLHWVDSMAEHLVDRTAALSVVRSAGD